MNPEKTASNLPSEPNDFVGRERDVADLCRMLENTRSVTLCGPGGIGKTRLGLRVALSMAPRHRDGAWLVELADAARPGHAAVAPTALAHAALANTEEGRDPVTRRVASVFGIADEGDRPLRDTLTDALAGRELLLFLDNCEHLVEECAGLAGRLLAACPGVRVLATSREPLRMPGENTWRVPPLAVPRPRAGAAEAVGHEAVRLFLARAGAARSGFTLTESNTEAVVELCRALDGLPLALELAAARVRVLSVEQIAARLADRFRLLSAGDRTAPPRQRTLRAAIDWSHDLLSGPERVLLRRLSVFSGFTLEQAERICADAELPEEEILDLVTALVDKSLVVVDREVAGKTRFRLLDSIRTYAAERLTESGEEQEVRGRHREVFLEGVELDSELALAGRPGSWAARMEFGRRYDHELDNVRAALAWSLERRDVEEGLRLCTALRAYCLPRGYFAECEEWSERFAELGRAGVSPGVLAAWLVMRAEVAVEQRDFERAGRFAAEGLPLARRAGDETSRAVALTVLGAAAADAGDFEVATRRLDEALTVARADGDAWNEGLALLTLGGVRMGQNRWREAQATLESSLRVMRGIDQLWGAGRALITLGQLARMRGDYETSVACYEQVLPIMRGIGAGPDLARCLGGLGRAALESGDLVAARRALSESLGLARAMGLRIAVARSLDAFGALVAREGDPVLAVRLVAAAAGLRETMGRPASGGARLAGLLEPVRRKLGEQRVSVLWSEGLVLGMESAVALALTPPGSAPGEDRTMAFRPVSVPARRAAGHAAPAFPADSAQQPPHLPAPPPPAHLPSTLTPREREIVRLITRGLSNKGIAEELVISPATVARHVTNMLTKLGFASRAQVAAWAVDHGLADGGDPDV
jgi:predicted ATPase/DNA-binding CsgD family transcriptional regulator